ncbi:MAG TPA: hypothetical protein VFO34_11700 [Candidatus Acidoferrales bacterium]|nr:hypothetical protein [Candidatus Acidoferrales bacterium]
MRRRQLILLIGILGFATLAAKADDFWAKKDSTQWSKDECRKLLTDSPWAKRAIVENNNSNTSMPSASRDAGSSGGANYGTGEIDYRVQLRSAAPVHQALIRQRQLDANYDAMSAADKKAFDAKTDAMFTDITDDVVAVHVNYSANRDELANVIAQTWRNVGEGTVPADLCIIGDGNKKVTAVKYAASPDSSEFDALFPRSAVGGAKSIKIQIPSPPIGDFGGKLVNIEFKLDKMTFNGKPSF